MIYTNLGHFKRVGDRYKNANGAFFNDIVAVENCTYFLADLSGRIVGGGVELSRFTPFNLTVIKVTDGATLLTDFNANQETDMFYYVWDSTEIKLHAPPKAEWLAVVVGRINNVHAEFLGKLTGNASTEERDTWPIKLALAKQVIADTASSTDIDLMSVEAVGAGITTLELANVIVTKAGNYSRLIWLAGSIRKKGIEQVKAASEYSEVAAIETGLLADVDAAVVEYLTAIGGAS